MWLISLAGRASDGTRRDSAAGWHLARSIAGTSGQRSTRGLLADQLAQRLAVERDSATWPVVFQNLLSNVPGHRGEYAEMICAGDSEELDLVVRRGAFHRFQ